MGNASDIHLQPLITTQIFFLNYYFSSYCSHINILFKHHNVLLFLRIGLQMFKYEYGQLPDALNMFFFVKKKKKKKK